MDLFIKKLGVKHTKKKRIRHQQIIEKIDNLNRNGCIKQIMIIFAAESCFYYNNPALSVAQLVEQLTLNQWVTGSNPVGETQRAIL